MSSRSSPLEKEILTKQLHLVQYRVNLAIAREELHEAEKERAVIERGRKTVVPGILPRNAT